MGLVVLEGTTDDTTLTASSNAVRSQRIFILGGAEISGAELVKPGLHQLLVTKQSGCSTWQMARETG